MSRNRIVLAAVALVVLATLLLWQRQRLNQVQACVAQGGIWDGSASVCKPDPNRILIQRELQRS